MEYVEPKHFKKEEATFEWGKPAETKIVKLTCDVDDKQFDINALMTRNRALERENAILEKMCNEYEAKLGRLTNDLLDAQHEVNEKDQYINKLKEALIGSNLREMGNV